MIKAIAFDLWETLITDTPELSRAQERLRLERMEEILVARGFAGTAAAIEQAYRRVWAPPPGPPLVAAPPRAPPPPDRALPLEARTRRLPRPPPHPPRGG